MIELTLEGIKQARQHLSLISHDPARATLSTALDKAEAELRRPLIFRSLSPTRWVIGWQGEEREFESKLVGLSPAWIAISAPAPQGVSAADFAKPGSKRARNIVRTAIRETAPPWISREARCPALAAEFLKIKVEDGRAEYHPDSKSPRIITGLTF